MTKFKDGRPQVSDYIYSLKRVWGMKSFMPVCTNFNYLHIMYNYLLGGESIIHRILEFLLQLMYNWTCLVCLPNVFQLWFPFNIQFFSSILHWTNWFLSYRNISQRQVPNILWEMIPLEILHMLLCAFTDLSLIPIQILPPICEEFPTSHPNVNHSFSSTDASL